MLIINGEPNEATLPYYRNKPFPSMLKGPGLQIKKAVIVNWGLVFGNTSQTL
jgi:hypothetical protein